MTFARHFWFVIKVTITSLYALPRRYKVWGSVAGFWAYKWSHWDRWPYHWQVLHRQFTVFVLTILQIAIPVMYLSCRLVFGLLYPAYASYKAVKTKNVKEYVKWMMYWIVFALFCAVETFTDVFLSWLPFYYEVKIIFVFWLLSPVTKGSSFLYRKFIHPQLNKREKKFVWIAKLSGVPRAVLWPGKVIRMLADGQLLIYIKSDHAELTVKSENVSPFIAEEVQECLDKSESVLVKKKRIATLRQLQEDIDWILEEKKESENDEIIPIVADEIHKSDFEEEDLEKGSANDEIVPIVADEIHKSDFGEADLEKESKNDEIIPIVADEIHKSDFEEEDLEESENDEIVPIVADEIHKSDFEKEDVEKESENDEIIPIVAEIHKSDFDEEDLDRESENDEIIPIVAEIHKSDFDEEDLDRKSENDEIIRIVADEIHNSDFEEEDLEKGSANDEIIPIVADEIHKSDFAEEDLEKESENDEIIPIVANEIHKTDFEEEDLEKESENDEIIPIVLDEIHKSDFEEEDLDIDDDRDKDYIPDDDSESDENEGGLDYNYRAGKAKALGEDQFHVSDSEEEDADNNIESLPDFLKFIRNEGQLQEATIENQGDEATNHSLLTSQKPSQRQRKVKEEEMIRDSKYKNVFIKRYVRSATSKSGGVKKDARPYDTVHCCKFCLKLYTHIQDHIQNVHFDKEEVKEVMSLCKQMADAENKKPLQKKIKELQDCIRYSGDHIHNKMVRKCKEGELLIQRKSCSNEEFKLENYGPCPRCMQWIKIESSAKNHQENCPKVSSKKHSKNLLIWQASQLISPVEASGSDMLLKEVILKMRNNKVSRCAKGDPLICKLGDVWLSKNISHTLRRGKDSSFHMRLAAKLLLACSKLLEKPGLDMMELLTVKHYDAVVQVTLALCGRNEDDELHHPSTANKLGFDIARLVGLKYGLCLRNKDSAGKEEAGGFLKLIQIHWSTSVTKRAGDLLRKRHFENRRQLPHPKDIETVATKLSSMLEDFNYMDKAQYVKVAKTVLLRLMVYNRRRSGEIEELRIETFMKRKHDLDDVEESLLGELTSTEKYLIQSQELMWIRGKRGKRVPVLIPLDTTEALNYIVKPEVRRLAGLKETNKYMFATRGDGVISASQSIGELGKENADDLIHPDRLTSTGYRAYMATIAQCLGLKDHQVQWLCTHLGHTEDVHKTHYRFALDGIERVQLSKLLILQDKNLLHKYRDTSLENIEFEDIISSVDGKDSSSNSLCEAAEVPDVGGADLDIISSVDGKDSSSNSLCEAAEVFDVGGADLGMSDLRTNKVKQTKAQRIRWTENEIQEIRHYAGRYLDKRKTPSRALCRTFIQKSKDSGGELHKRSADLIVKKISAMNVKEIDEAIDQARTKGYKTLMTLGHKGLTYATNAVVTTAIKGQSTLVEHVRKSYSTNDLRVREVGDDKDEPDSSIGFMDESDDEFDKSERKSSKQTVTPATDNRLRADNKELSSREKKDRAEKSSRRGQLTRSKSDASESQSRVRRTNRTSVSDLTPLDEVEHESSIVHDQDGNEMIETVETFYISTKPQKHSRITSKEVKADPYATLPRTRSRQRPRLNQY